MSSALVARRPVFNRELDVAAYEILVAEGEEDEAAAAAGDAVARLVLEVAGETGLEQLLGGKPAWLSLPLPAAQQAVDANLRQQRATIELRLNGDGDPRSTIAGLRALGHSVALPVDPKADGDLLHGADIAAIDVASMESDEMAETVKRIKAAG